MIRMTAPVLAAVLLVSSALAQSSLTDPDAPRAGDKASADRTQQLVDELRALVDRAERDRLADRGLIWDLRDLASRYDVPWRVVLFNDDFRDGDFQRAPVWQVAAGRWIVDRSLGLRSAVQPAPEPAAPTQQSQQQQQQGDVASQVLGALLQEALKSQSSGSQQAQRAASAPEPDRPARIESAAAVSNAFQLQLDLSSWQDLGQFEIALPFADQPDGSYALVYAIKATPGLRLVRRSRYGEAVIDAYDGTVTLEDSRLHTIEWTRDRQGQMVVTVDGQEAIRTSDRYYNGDFAGVALINHAGDYAVRALTIRGTTRG